MKKNILVIDDNKNDLLMAKFVVMRMGYNPILLENPLKVISALQNDKIELIVLDYDMPGMSGLDVLKKIRKVEAFKSVPVVMLTGNSSPQHVKSTVASGAVDYIVKPIDPAIFETKVNKILATDTAQKAAWIEYELQKNQNTEIKIQNSAQIISIGEISITLKTNQAYPVGFTFFSDAGLFTELEIKNPALKVESSTNQGDYSIVKCTMLGLSEAELKKLRLYHQLLVTKKSA